MGLCECVNVSATECVSGASVSAYVSVCARVSAYVSVSATACVSVSATNKQATTTKRQQQQQQQDVANAGALKWS